MKQTFPNKFKNADVVPLLKKGGKCRKKNYRLISKLPNISKVFERIMYDDIIEFMTDRLFLYLSGYRSNYSPQHTLLSIIDKV